MRSTLRSSSSLSGLWTRIAREKVEEKREEVARLGVYSSGLNAMKEVMIEAFEGTKGDKMFGAEYGFTSDFW